ncbi:MAG: response regulator, partial [Hyphomicrobiaceae bacterium]
MRVLVIEDDGEVASYIQKALKESGHASSLAADGEIGFTMALAGDYDVLVIDRMLPKLDGLSLIRLLRDENINA